MSFVQYKRCEICCKNHNSGNKHIYSASHKSNVERLIKKFKDKVAECRQVLVDAIVEDGSKQDTRHFWCYFCNHEYQRDKKLENMLLKEAAMIEHLASLEHLRNCTSFLAENRVEHTMKEEFVVETVEYKKFLEATQKSVRQFEEKKHKKQLEVADKIRKESFISARMVDCYREMIGCAITKQHSQVTNCELPLVDVVSMSETWRTKGVCTIDAHGEGLTRVKMQNAHNFTGNVFSDASPPWVQQETTSTGVIGPTLDDLHKHVEKTRKRKLPAARVGADFKHKERQSSTWLPSFGRVWSTKRSSCLTYRGQYIKHKRKGT
ncbi:hypothetical protein LSAT2_013970 [Lamellibrachia satsuma]|nr:hypothetical protein LSAT2_013970 [Lamellibrachia satsuma]